MKSNHSSFTSAICFAVQQRVTVVAAIFVLMLAGFPCAVSARPSLTITFDDGGSVRFQTDRDRFFPVGVLASETANIQLQVPASFAGTTLRVEALDGGAVTEYVVVASDGTASITFQAGDRTGLYRILASALGKRATLQFWVLSVDNPDADPPVIFRTYDGT